MSLQPVIRGRPQADHPVLRRRLTVIIAQLILVTVPLPNVRRTINLLRPRSRQQLAPIRPQPLVSH